MKKFFLACFLFLLTSTLYAAPFSKIIFFGDSLTDDGELYAKTLKIIPKFPPYFKGRFSNGRTWAEYVGQEYYNRYYTPYKIYAVGGATSIWHKPQPRFASLTTLNMEITSYLTDDLFRSKSDVLFVIWIGGNDYLFDVDADRKQEPIDVVRQMVTDIKLLLAVGAKHFLIFNLPDLAKLPIARQENSPDRLIKLTVAHNNELLKQVQQLRAQNSQAEFMLADMYTLFNKVIADPDFYNKKYKVNITNTTEACWKGDYIFGATTSQALAQRISADLKKVPGQSLDVDTLGQLIANNPILRQTYKVGEAYKQGRVPCADAMSYVFWDSVHPTNTVHRVLGSIVVKMIEEQRR